MDSGLEQPVGHVSHLLAKVDDERVLFGLHLVPCPVQLKLKSRILKDLEEGEKSAVLVGASGDD